MYCRDELMTPKSSRTIDGELDDDSPSAAAVTSGSFTLLIADVTKLQALRAAASGFLLTHKAEYIR